MEVSITIPDDLAQRLLNTGNASRQVLEAFVFEAYREDKLTLFEVSQLLGLTRIETEDLLGQHKIPLADITEADLDREAKLFEEIARRRDR
jgi:predicted HTH domain antitoxin